MKRLMVILQCCVLLTTSLFCGGMAECQDADRAGQTRTRLSALPDAEWQLKADFPDWKNYTDDTLAMNSMVSFRGYHGQGVLYLNVAEVVEGFNLYVNGDRQDTAGLSGGMWKLDISASTVDGVNTLQISNILPLGLEKPITVCIPYPTVLPGDGDLQGINPKALQLIEDIIASDVTFGFPSAQLAVVKNGRLVYENAWGRVNNYDPNGTPKLDSPAVTVNTMYDLASVTKMFSANYAVQKLVTDGALDLDAPLVTFFGDAFAEETMDFTYSEVENAPDLDTQKAWKRSLTVRDILCHQAGFPAGPHYNNPDYDMSMLAVGEPGCNLCYATSREDMLYAIFKTPLQFEPRTRTLYSDVDYMLACFVIETVTGQRLDEYLQETFCIPLGLDHITFQPLEHGFEPDDCAATELNGNTRDLHIAYPGIRTATIQGEVHDERAYYCMEGVSGHAGLFASASDLARLASVMLTGGYGEYRFFSRAVLDGFTAPKAVSTAQWGLGWWREGDQQRPWYFGTQSASNTIGHQGWTGTMAMIDPSRELVVVYLTNKINSPITNPDNLNGFDGGCYTASTLGFVPQILSIGMDSNADVSGQLLDLLADMAAESVKLIPEGADETHPYARNARSKIAVLKSWAEADGNEAYIAFAESLIR